MPHNIPEYNPSFECLKDIMRIVQARIHPDSRVELTCFQYIDKHYIQFKGPGSHLPIPEELPIRNDPGIPTEALIPEKVAPIAYWIWRQVRKQKPEWFIAGEIIP